MWGTGEKKTSKKFSSAARRVTARPFETSTKSGKPPLKKKVLNNPETEALRGTIKERTFLGSFALHFFARGASAKFDTVNSNLIHISGTCAPWNSARGAMGSSDS